MSKAIKAVCVWLDSDSNPAEPKWIVSRDTLDGKGRAETTSTLSVYDTEAEAVEEGKVVATKLGLPLYRNPANSPAELVEVS